MGTSFQILALHGFTGCGEDFLYLDQATPDNWQWHYPNLPGHGPNPLLDSSPEATTALIGNSLSEFNVPRVLLGYSMGARAALQHACAHPEQWDALILISGNPGIESEFERASRRQSDAQLADRIEAEGVSAFLKFWQQTPMIRSQQTIRPDWRHHMQQNRMQHTAQGLAQSLRQFGQGACPNLWPELNKLSMPALLISGEEDRKYSEIAQRMRSTILHAEHVIIPSAGHMPQLEAPEATLAEIERFLSKF